MAINGELNSRSLMVLDNILNRASNSIELYHICQERLENFSWLDLKSVHGSSTNENYQKGLSTIPWEGYTFLKSGYTSHWTLDHMMISECFVDGHGAQCSLGSNYKLSGIIQDDGILT